MHRIVALLCALLAAVRTDAQEVWPITEANAEENLNNSARASRAPHAL